MKDVFNFTIFLIFLLVLAGLLWAIPIPKINTIGDLFNKVLTPISIPLSLIISTKLGIKKYKRYKHTKKDKSP